MFSFLSDIAYYEGDKADVRTKSVIAREISFCEKELKSAKTNDSDMVEEFTDVVVSSFVSFSTFFPPS